MLSFDGIRVLDLTRLIPGPVCSLLLADQGADVIKIEQPVAGDYARWYVPRVGDYAAIFHAMNRNKRSVALDLKQPQGSEIFQRLVAEADVVMESFRPGALQRLGLDYESLRAVNPRIILCSLSGFGQTGSLTPAHDLNLAGLSGILATGNFQPLPIQAMDFGSAYLAAFAIAAALFQRERTQQGAHLDVAMLDAGLSLMALARAESSANNRPPQPAHELLTGGFACYRSYATSDGKHIVLAALEEKFWRNFCQIVNRDDLTSVSYLDPDEQAHLMTELETLFATKSYAEWVALLDDTETCASPVLDVLETSGHPIVQARGSLYNADDVAHTHSGLRIGDDAPPAHMTAPHLGEHTREILQAAGYTSPEMEAWMNTGVIA